MKRRNLIIVALLGLCICTSGVWAKGITESSQDLRVVPNQQVDQVRSQAGLAIAQQPGQQSPDSGTTPILYGVQPVPPPPVPPDPGNDRVRWEPGIWMSIWVLFPKAY